MILDKIDSKVLDEFQELCKLREKDPAEEITRLLQLELVAYKRNSERLQYHKAYLFENRNEAKRRMWEISHPDEPIPDTKRECWYLYDTTIFDAPYRAIILDGQIVKVPAEEVELTDAET